MYLTCALLILAASGETPPAPPWPLVHADPILAGELRDRLRSGDIGEALAQQSLAVALVDLSREDAPLYAGINDDLMLYAASLPKIGILLAVLEGVNAGRIPWGPEHAHRLEKMITISNNAYASWGYDLAGVNYIAEVLQRPEYLLYVRPAGGLWVGRPFRKGGVTRRDPEHNISHGASARQVARFYLLLQMRRLVSPYWSERMLDLMGPPEYVHKFVASLRGRRGVRFVARKSGTWTTFHADSAIIDQRGRRYILVGLADHPDGERLLRGVARVADDLIREGPHRRRGVLDLPPAQ